MRGLREMSWWVLGERSSKKWGMEKDLVETSRWYHIIARERMQKVSRNAAGRFDRLFKGLVS
jgi:hypothetical protein